MMLVKLNPETTSHIITCAKYPHGSVGTAIGWTKHSQMVRWSDGKVCTYDRSELIEVKLHPHRPYMLGVIAFIVFIVLTLSTAAAFAQDNDDLAFEFINSEPVYEVRDVVFEYECKFTTGDWFKIVNTDLQVGINELNLDPRDYCQSIKDILDEY